MKTDTPQTVYLKDYTPPAFWIDTVDLDFDIDAGGTTVSATLALRLARVCENATIVTIVCDRGDRYLSTGLFPA